MKKIILASASPRRKDIFKTLNLEFEIMPSTYVEKLNDNVFSYKKIENLAFNKANEVVKMLNEDALVVGADTVVVIDSLILGKPKSRADAFNMLKNLSDRKHFVVTSICVIDSYSQRKKINSTTSYVEFEKLTDDMINSYIDKYKPFDKAGAYGIQELPQGFVKNIDGSFENIVGLCPKALKKTLEVFIH